MGGLEQWAVECRDMLVEVRRGGGVWGGWGAGAGEGGAGAGARATGEGGKTCWTKGACMCKGRKASKRLVCAKWCTGARETGMGTGAGSGGRAGYDPGRAAHQGPPADKAAPPASIR